MSPGNVRSFKYAAQTINSRLILLLYYKIIYDSIFLAHSSHIKPISEICLPLNQGVQQSGFSHLDLYFDLSYSSISSLHLGFAHKLAFAHKIRNLHIK